MLVNLKYNNFVRTNTYNIYIINNAFQKLHLFNLL